MLSEVALVKARQAIETLYSGICSVMTYEKVLKSNKTTGMSEAVKYAEIPCRVSYSKSSTVALQENLAGAKGQQVKLFIAPELDIPPDCKIIVTQDGLTVEYSASAQRAHYPTHQEIELILFEKWA